MDLLALKGKLKEFSRLPPRKAEKKLKFLSLRNDNYILGKLG